MSDDLISSMGVLIYYDVCKTSLFKDCAIKMSRNHIRIYKKKKLYSTLSYITLHTYIHVFIYIVLNFLLHI